MLTYKRYKQLKARRKELTIDSCLAKSKFKHHNKYNHSVKASIWALELNKLKREITYINDILRMHKILWKQHLAQQPKKTDKFIMNEATCGYCHTPCRNDHCVTRR